jgi:hypothetical protein
MRAYRIAQKPQPQLAPKTATTMCFGEKRNKKECSTKVTLEDRRAGSKKK